MSEIQMQAQVNAPLTPFDCDLRDFAFMPLDVQRLRDSDLAALETPEACWAAVLLWGASWHQVPAASLPNDDKVLCNLAGYGRVVREWKKVRDGALRGFVLCADGRLYHPVVAEKAVESWARKLEQRWRTECARIRKQNQRTGEALPLPTLEDFLAGRPASVPRDTVEDVPKDKAECPIGQSPLSLVCPTGNAIQGTGTGTGTGTSYSETKVSASPGLGSDLDALAWDAARLLLEDRAGMSGDAARKFFGRLLSTYHLEARDLFPAVTSATVNNTHDPKSYLTKAAMSLAKRRADTPPKRVAFV